MKGGMGLINSLVQASLVTGEKQLLAGVKPPTQFFFLLLFTFLYSFLNNKQSQKKKKKQHVSSFFFPFCVCVEA